MGFRFGFIAIYLSFFIHGTIKFRLSYICLGVVFVVLRKILYRILTRNKRITKHFRNIANLLTDVDAGRSKVRERHFLDGFSSSIVYW